MQGRITTTRESRQTTVNVKRKKVSMSSAYKYIFFVNNLVDFYNICDLYSFGKMELYFRGFFREKKTNNFLRLTTHCEINFTETIKFKNNERYFFIFVYSQAREITCCLQFCKEHMDFLTQQLFQLICKQKCYKSSHHNL